MRVLVVDDEPYITDVVSSALAFEGFATEEATTVAEALSHARTGTFDCIVLDVMLPDGDGFTVCRTLREEAIATPVLFLTARDAGPDKLTGLGLGDDYVTKPFSIDELVARIRAVLRRTGTAADDCRLRVADLVMDAEQRTVSPGRRGHRTDGHRVQPAGVPGRQPPPGTVPGPDPRRGLGRRLRRRVEHRRDLHLLPPQEGRPLRPPALIHTVRGVGYTMREPRP